MRCHYVYDKKAGKVHIPGCWGAVMNGPKGCYCYPRKEVDERDKTIQDLEKEVARLNRIIKKLIRK